MSQRQINQAAGSCCPWCERSSKRACCTFAVTGALRAFAAAYGIRAGLSILMTLLKGRLSFRTAYSTLVAADPVRLGAVVGLLSGLARSVRCALSRLRGKDDKLNAALAGFAGGLSAVLDNPSRRTDLALYLLCRGLYAIVHTALRLKVLPRVPGALMILFGAANSLILYSLAYEPHLLDRSYYAFLLKVLDTRHEDIQWTLRDPRNAAMALKGRHCAQPSVLAQSQLQRFITPPAVSAHSLDAAIGGVAGCSAAALSRLEKCASHAALAPHLTAAASAVVRDSFVVPLQLASAQQRAGQLDVPLSTAWAHAALLGVLQPPEAYRHCDVVWHPGKTCLGATTSEVLPLMLR
jgi:hypothetical protein